MPCVKSAIHGWYVCLYGARSLKEAGKPDPSPVDILRSGFVQDVALEVKLAKTHDEVAMLLDDASYCATVLAGLPVATEDVLLEITSEVARLGQETIGRTTWMKKPVQDEARKSAILRVAAAKSFSHNVRPDGGREE